MYLGVLKRGSLFIFWLCCLTFGILVPWPGVVSPAAEAWSLNPRPLGKFRKGSLWMAKGTPTTQKIPGVIGALCQVWGCRGWQSAGTWVSVSPEIVGFPTPIGPLEPANQQAPKREQREHEGKRKSPRMPKFEQAPAKVCTNRIALQTCNQSA